MTSGEKRFIADFLSQLAKPTEIRLIETDDARTESFAAFGRELLGESDRIRVARGKGEPGEPPGFVIAPNVIYHAVPGGPEMVSFLEAILFSGGHRTPDSALRDELRSLETPADITVFIGPECRFCPETVRKFIPLPFANDHIRLTVEDALFFPETAQRHLVRSVPTVLLDDSFRWTGECSPAEVIEVLKGRKPSGLTLAVLERMFREGQALRFAALVREENAISSAFVDALAHPHLTVRLGAMAAAEQLLDEAPTLARQLARPLWDRFESAEDQAKGDILYLLGELKETSLLSAVEEISRHTANEDVREAAVEALEKLRA